MTPGSFLGFSHVVGFSGGLVRSCRSSARCEALHAACCTAVRLSGCLLLAWRLPLRPSTHCIPLPHCVTQVLPRALRHMLAKSDDKTKAAVNKVIRVWDERKVG